MGGGYVGPECARVMITLCGFSKLVGSDTLCPSLPLWLQVGQNRVLSLSSQCSACRCYSQKIALFRQKALYRPLSLPSMKYDTTLHGVLQKNQVEISFPLSVNICCSKIHVKAILKPGKLVIYPKVDWPWIMYKKLVVNW